MFVVVVLYCVQLLSGETFFKVNYDPSAIINWLIIKDALLKPIKKTLKQFFKGVVHEQHWSSIVCLLWWSSIVSSFVLKIFVFQNHFLISFSFPLL